MRLALFRILGALTLVVLGLTLTVGHWTPLSLASSASPTGVRADVTVPSSNVAVAPATVDQGAPPGPPSGSPTPTPTAAPAAAPAGAPAVAPGPPVPGPVPVPIGDCKPDHEYDSWCLYCTQHGDPRICHDPPGYPATALIPLPQYVAL